MMLRARIALPINSFGAAEGLRALLSTQTFEATVPPGEEALADAQGHGPLTPASARTARVERVDTQQFRALETAFRSLADAAPEANAFLEPALLEAAQRADPSKPIVVLLAWDAAADGRLIGAWAFSREGGLLPRLRAPAVPFASLGSPVILPDWTEDVLAAWFALLRADRTLPKLLDLNPSRDTGPFRVALDRLVARGGCASRVTARHRRAMLASDLDADTYLRGTMSGSRRAKLRQLRAKLGRQGAVQYVVHEGDAVPAAAETFLALEALGWKGRRGSAMQSDAAQADFVRRALDGLAAQGLASISELTLDGRTLSMCVLLRSGGTAFTWKIAYDESCGAYSPGYQLALEDTARLLSDPATLRSDSCAAAEVGMMSEIWGERADTADLYIGVRSGRSPIFTAEMAFLAFVRLIPELRRKLQLRSRLKPLAKRLRALRRPGASAPTTRTK
jgi:CelD/BcsL family acetyltransferase involved in cellulose biosynthesis